MSFSPSLVRYYKSYLVAYNDFDLYKEHGFYQIVGAGSIANSPVSTGHGFIMNFAWENARTMQFYFGGSGDVGIWMRVCISDVWNSWKTIWQAT